MSSGNEPIPPVALQIVRGRSSRKSRPMAGGTLLVGSDPQCDVQLRSAEVAPKHCLLSRRAGQVTATRLSVDHPVTLNGKPLAEDAVHDGDELGIGPFAMKILIGQAALAGGPPPPPMPTAVARPRFALLDRKPNLPPAVEDVPPSELPPEPSVPSASLDARQELDDAERKLQAWQQRLEGTAAELDDRRGELATAVSEFERRRQTLERRQERLRTLLEKHRVERRKKRSRFASLLGALNERAANVGRREAELQERERRWTAVAAELDDKHAALAERTAVAERQIAQLQERQTALAAERALLDKEWQRLFARQQEVAREAQEVAARQAQVAEDERTLKDVRRRTAEEIDELNRDRNAVQARAAATDAHAVRLRGQERRLDARAQEIAERAGDAERRDAELDSKAEKLQHEAETLRQAVERERSEIERGRSALDAEFARHEADKAAFAESQSQWRSAVARHERERTELGRTASLLAARERELADRERESSASFRAEIAHERTALAAEQERLAAQAAALDRERGDLDSRSEELADRVRGLEARQEQLLQRERTLAGAAEAERRTLDERAAELAAKHADVDRLAEAQRRQVERMRSAGFRFGQRRKILLDRLAELDAKGVAYRREIAALAASRDELRRELDDFVARARERERQAALWLQSIRRDAEQLADAHRRLDRHVRADGQRSGPERTELQRRLGDWSQRMTKLQQRLADGARALSLDDQEPPALKLAAPMPPTPDAPLARLAPEPEEPALETIPLAAANPTPAPTEPPAPAEPPAPKRAAPPAWAFKLSDLGLADREVVEYLLSRAKPGGPPLERSLVDAGVVTQFQVECVRDGRIEELNLGPIRLLDVVHRGRIQTIYRVRTAGFDRDVALRLFAPTVAASADMRHALAAAMSPLVSFRHPNVASIFALVNHRTQIGLLTDFVLGAPLAAGQADRDPATTIRCFRQTAAALAAVQRAGFMHRNLRPSRILVSNLGRVSLVGFGEPDWLVNLYRCEAGDAADRFLAPERREPGRTADARADLFAAARIFAETILGRRPEPGVRLILPDDYPEDFVEILAQCAAYAPDDRCRSIAEVVEKLDRLLSPPVVAPPEPAPDVRMAA